MSEWLYVLGFVSVVTLIIIWNAWAYWRMFGSLPTFDEYRCQHPELFKNGRCRCHKCGGGRVFLHTLDPFRRRHICATCSTVLYRS